MDGINFIFTGNNTRRGTYTVRDNGLLLSYSNGETTRMVLDHLNRSIFNDGVSLRKERESSWLIGTWEISDRMFEGSAISLTIQSDGNFVQRTIQGTERGTYAVAGNILRLFRGIAEVHSLHINHTNQTILYLGNTNYRKVR